MAKNNLIQVGGELVSTDYDGIVAAADAVKDYTPGRDKTQKEINDEVQQGLEDRYTKEETYNRDEIETLVDPTNYVSVVATDQTTAVTDLLPAEGATDTIYRIGNWDGTQYDPTVYALYSWNGTAYVCLAVRSFVGEIYDISVNHPDGQGNPAVYSDLAAALGTDGANIPSDIRQGGMTVKFIQNVPNSDNKYMQYRYMGTATTGSPNPFTNVDNWQGVDDVPTAGSDNLVKSGGVESVINTINGKVTELKNAVQDLEDDTLYVADQEGNVVVKVDNNGIKATDVIVPDGEEDVHLLEKIKEVEENIPALDIDSQLELKDGSDELLVCDNEGNTVLKVDKKGTKTTDIDTKHLNESNLKLYKDKFYLSDKNGYVVFMVDKDGIHVNKIDSADVLKNTWAGKVMATYGDSITAINNGDFAAPIIPQEYNWGNEVARFFSFAKHYGRGIGATCFKYRTSGGQVAWVRTATGEYVARNDNYTYDNYEGHVTIPSDCTPIRGDGSSFLRISSMFPASMRETIDVILVMFHNDYHQDMDTDVEWIANDTTDPEWAASSYYSALGGDYNISTVKGGIASTVMKLQTLMPQAMIVLMTPIGGVYTTTGEISGDFNNIETSKMKKLAEVVMDVAQRMNTPCINVYGTCGINTLNRTTYIADTIHPYTVAGRKKVGRAVISGLMGQIASL